MYSYKEQRERIFTDEGQIVFLKVRDKVKELLEIAGAIQIINIINNMSGDGWLFLACFDRLLELKEITEIENTWNSAAQYRIFIK